MFAMKKSLVWDSQLTAIESDCEGFVMQVNFMSAQMIAASSGKKEEAAGKLNLSFYTLLPALLETYTAIDKGTGKECSFYWWLHTCLKNCFKVQLKEGFWYTFYRNSHEIEHLHTSFSDPSLVSRSERGQNIKTTPGYIFSEVYFWSSSSFVLLLTLTDHHSYIVQNFWFCRKPFSVNSDWHFDKIMYKTPSLFLHLLEIITVFVGEHVRSLTDISQKLNDNFH